MKKPVLSIILFYIALCSLFSQEIIENNPSFSVLKGKYLGQNPPGIFPEIFAPNILLKPKQAHSNIVFSVSGDSAYWCHNGIWFSQFKDGTWTSPLNVPFSKMEYSDDAPFLSPDGKKLFFTSKRPISPPDTIKKENIWVVDIDKDGWSEAYPLPPVINDMFEHWQISVDLIGNIYFNHTTIQDSIYDADIYCSKFEENQYLKPIKLGLSVNSEDQEINPFISPKGDFLIFSRMKNRKPLNGGLFICIKLKNDAWSEAIPLQEYFDFIYGGNCAIVTQDEKYLFFLDIFEGKWQRYWISFNFIENLKPKN
jgi:hypothetical protein